MAFSQSQLAAIDAAIASGELEIEYDDKRIKYRSMTELMQARDFIANQLASASGQTVGGAWLAEHTRD